MNIEKLRSLLSMAHGPGVEREPEENRSPAGLATVYLGYEVADLLLRDAVAADAVWQSWSLPRRVQTTKVALALAWGLDPGEHGLACIWEYSSIGERGWCVSGTGRFRKFIGAAAFLPSHVSAPIVANELNSAKALFFAVDYTLKT